MWVVKKLGDKVLKSFDAALHANILKLDRAFPIIDLQNGDEYCARQFITVDIHTGKISSFPSTQVTSFQT